MRKNFYIATFGCRTNQADSAALRQDFVEAEYREVEDHADADVIILNSCTVTHRSDQQVRQLTRKMRRENPEAKILLTGCYVQRDPERVAGIRGVDGVVGNTRKTGLVQISQEMERRDREEPADRYVDDFRKMRALELTPATQLGGKTRPFVKIQDGCDAKCSYCIIPTVRGPGRSVPPHQILDQVESLSREGFREVVLTGIHIGTYGMHLHPRFPLDRLLARLVELPGLGQIRVSSIEPMELSRRVIDLAAETDKIAPHFHICLQSGSDRILKKMLRPYDTHRFRDIVQEIREKIPQAGIGTDIISGFPGETEQDHEATLSFIEEAPFTYLHVFPYSERSGTPAASMNEKVHPGEIKRRSAELRSLGRRKNRSFQRAAVGSTVRTITLTQTKGDRREAVTGNYLKALVDTETPGNALLEVEVDGLKGGYALCSPLREL